jgi:hypothetical protein
MKKIFVLIAFLFAVVCYASPPPDVGQMASDDVVFVADQNQAQVQISVPEAEAQEVAFVYLGNAEIPAGNAEAIEEPAFDIKFAELPEIYVDLQLTELNKPPSFYRNKAGKTRVKRNFAFYRNAQNSNHGYPLTAN